VWHPYAGPVSREITQGELRNNSGEIMRKLDEGEALIVTRNGVPVGDLAPLRRHSFITAEAAVALFGAAPPIDAEQFRTALDSVVSQDLAPNA
jgi:antitoxin (DNA-binding transcriptional repressor) of toxin-antitoxin stability system